MSVRTLPATDPDLGATERKPARPSSHPIVLALTSALLFWLAFPPADCGWLAWFALAPFFSLVYSDRSRWSVYLGAWLGGLAFWLLGIEWVRRIDPSAWLAWVAMAATLSLWWPGFLWLARLGVRRLKLPLMAVAPVAWVALEYVRAYFLTGFPWFFLAHTQYRYVPLIQVADFAGAYGLSVVLALANAWLVDLVVWPLFRPTDRGPRLTRAQRVRAGVVASAVLGTLGYGAFRLATARFRDGPRVALIQSQLEQEYKMSSKEQDILEVYERLVARAVRARPRPDLIVWPETAYPFGFVTIDPHLDAKTFATFGRKGTLDAWKTKMHILSDHLHNWVNETGVPMVVGTSTTDFQRSGVSRYNSAILFIPGRAAIQSYHKIHLVPFGEYVPLVKIFPWLTALTPYHSDDAPSLDFGSKPAWFDLNGTRMSAAICFEDTVPQVTRRFFNEADGGHQPDLLLNLSNDGWFHDSAEHEMHLAISVFRAVENRVPLARSVNTGISALIDGNGRIQASVPKLREDVLSGIAQLDDRVSLYTAWGDWLAKLCLVLGFALVPLALAGAVRDHWRLRRNAILPGLPKAH